MEKEAQLCEEQEVTESKRLNRRQLLRLVGGGIAGVVGADILAACWGGSTPPPVSGTAPTAAATVTATTGATRSLAPYFLGYNNVPIKSPAWTNPEVVKAATQIKPGTLRYPGGTVANYWDWQTGWFVPKSPFSKSQRSIYRLQELQIAVQATGAKPIYVLNMLTSDLNAQLEMLHTAKQMGLPIKFVELGNEFYLPTPGDYTTMFQTGRDYGTMATTWTRAIHSAFPEAEVAVVGSSPARNSRQANWNQDMFQTLQGADAITFHPYVPLNDGDVTPNNPSASAAKLSDTVSTRWQQFEGLIQALPSNMNMKVWLTEYNLNNANDISYTWIHGLSAAQMTLTFLQEHLVELVCFYDMIGARGFETIFYNQQGGDTILKQFTPTASGWTMRLLGSTMQGMTSAEPLSFSSSAGGITASAIQGWLFTDGTRRQAFIVNGSADNMQWEVGSTFPQGTQFQQLSGDPFKVVTGPESLKTSSGTLSSSINLPAYSVTQVGLS